MGAVHVIFPLEEESKLCRYISFVELVELLKFGQMHFEHANAFQRGRLLAAAAEWRRLPGRSQADGTSAARQARRRNQLLNAWPKSDLSFQSWSVMRDIDADHWNACPSSDQKIGIVTTARNLAESLLVPRNTTVIIGRAEELDLQEDAASSSRYGLTGSLAPQLPPEDVGVIAHRSYDESDSGLQRGMRLQIMLSSWLTDVVVAPYATDRFVELVAKVVSEQTSARVTRAGQRSFEGMRSAISRAYAPSFSMTEPVGYGLHGVGASVGAS